MANPLKLALKEVMSFLRSIAHTDMQEHRPPRTAGDAMRTNEARNSLQRSKKRSDESRHRQVLSKRDGPSALGLPEVDPLSSRTGAAPYSWAQKYSSRSLI